MKSLALYKLVLPFCLDGSACSWFKTAKTVPPVAHALPAQVAPIVSAPLLRQDYPAFAQGFGGHSVGQAAKKFNLAVMQQYGAQAISVSGNALRASGSFIKNTATAHPYATATLAAYALFGGYLRYQYTKHDNLVKKLEREKVAEARGGISEHREQQLDRAIAAAKNRAERVKRETFSKHMLARPTILASCLLGGTLLLALGFDAYKTFGLTGSLSISRFMLPEYAINLLPKTGNNPLVNFAGYRAIYTFARQQHFKPSDLALKTCLGATGGLLYCLQRWITIRNKSAQSIG